MKLKAGDMVERYGGKDRETGQAMVEWALVFPVFLLLVCGIIDFSWIGYQQLMFESSFQMTAWDFALNLQHPSGGSLDDDHILEGTEPLNYGTSSGNAVTVNGLPYALGAGIREHMLQSAPGLLKEDKLTVPNASAVFSIEPGEEQYTAGTDNIILYNYQLQVKIEGDLEYKVTPLTPLIRAIIPGGEVVLEKKLDRERTERVVVKRRVVIPASP